MPQRSSVGSCPVFDLRYEFRPNMDHLLALQRDHGVVSLEGIEHTEGMGILATRVSPETIIQTWNNALSDLVDQTMIDKSSPVYASLMDRELATRCASLVKE